MNCCNSDSNLSFNPNEDGVWNVTKQQTMSPQMSHNNFKGEPQAYIADSLQNMSVKERDEIYHEVHGVGDVIDETPEVLSQAINDMQEELSLCSIGMGSSASKLPCQAFNAAEEMNPSFVHNHRLYKVFLRAERFDAKKAAHRMIRFFDFKRRSFGNESLCRDITQDMLSATDMANFRKGFIQSLPWRDRMGRCVILIFMNSFEYDDPLSLARMILYNVSCLIKDVESQKKGAAVIIFSAGSMSSNVSQLLEQMQVMTDALKSNPLRYAVAHICFSDHRFQSIIKSGMQLVNPEFRARNKLHFGAPMECIYSLMGFGIPHHALPINTNGDFKNKPHIQRLKTLRKQEEWIRLGKLKLDSIEDPISRHDPRNVIVIPSLKDVVLGRGKPTNTQDGNNHLKQLVDEAVPQYEKMNRPAKTRLSHEIVRKIKEDFGGRFIKQDEESGIWVVVGDDTARLTVSNLFRWRRDTVLARLADETPQRLIFDENSGELPSKRMAVMAKQVFR